jgi:hypothetical protein
MPSAIIEVAGANVALSLAIVSAMTVPIAAGFRPGGERPLFSGTVFVSNPPYTRCGSKAASELTGEEWRFRG